MIEPAVMTQRNGHIAKLYRGNPSSTSAVMAYWPLMHSAISAKPQSSVDSLRLDNARIGSANDIAISDKRNMSFAKFTGRGRKTRTVRAESVEAARQK